MDSLGRGPGFRIWASSAACRRSRPGCSGLRDWRRLATRRKSLIGDHLLPLGGSVFMVMGWNLAWVSLAGLRKRTAFPPPPEGDGLHAAAPMFRSGSDFSRQAHDFGRTRAGDFARHRPESCRVNFKPRPETYTDWMSARLGPIGDHPPSERVRLSATDPHGGDTGLTRRRFPPRGASSSS